MSGGWKFPSRDVTTTSVFPATFTTILLPGTRPVQTFCTLVAVVLLYSGTRRCRMFEAGLFEADETTASYDVPLDP